MRPILICLLVGASGCASHPSLGAPVEDAARRTALLQACPRPHVGTAVYRTLVSWPGKQVSVTEVVRVAPDGGFSAAGVTDIGSTLYAAQIAPDGQGRVISKSLPFSDRWLLDGLVAELLLPWNGPDEACRLFADRASAPNTLVREAGDDLQVFLFDDRGHWQGLRRFTGGRLRCHASLEWDTESIPRRMRVDNPRNHYHVVRERVSLQPVDR
jgi:hypothetical protein